MLPLFRQHGIRWAKVARRGPRQADGITVLSDSRAPTAVHLAWSAVALVGVIAVFGPPLLWPAWMMGISPFT